ncbi:capsid protein [Xaviernesmea oryzae]|uniref:Capsid protein n=1 Tax=Xaviernesmea oryzae TaxID=464029 RepID=A0A1Q9B1I3_9HYPH|nr:phage major capsid protein [Xaviernesmea oryzae]OLP61850.1 capsid protein [Xaviernesmea oryzae]SEL75457.1 phage major capsid protein, HK97 family [Xaviernesmea oryzae]
MTELHMTGPTMTAPEIKTTPDTVASAFEDFMSAFEAFKETNDQRLDELEAKLSADVVTREKMDRINRAVDEHKRALDQLILRKARPALGSGDLPADMREHKAAFEAYLRKGNDQGLRELEGKAMSIGSATDGGYLVPPETDHEIGRRLAVVSPIRGLATVRQVTGAVLKKPFALAGMATGWVAETAARPQTNAPQLAELSFPTMELYAMPAATAALLDDAAVDVESWIASEVDIAFGLQEGQAFVTGDGANKPKGFLSYDAVADSNWNWGSLGYVATGAAGAFSSAGASDTLVDTIYALKAGYRRNAGFVMSRKTQAEIRKLKDSTGHYLWQPPASAEGKATLMGFPLTEAEEMPDIAPGSFAIAFGDFASGYLVVDRTGVRVLRDPYSAKPYVLFYTTKRVGGGIQNFEAIKLVKFAAA